MEIKHANTSMPLSRRVAALKFYRISAYATVRRNAKKKHPRVALVEMRGTIASGKNKINFGDVKKQFDRVRRTPGLAAVAILINSPGGSPSQSELIGDHIRRYAEQTKVPVYAFVEDMAASGGYWIAAAADKIFCAKSSQVGSIGVISSVMNFSKLADKYGIENVVVTAGESKSKLNPFKPVNEKDLQWLKGVGAELHVLFKSWVTKRRGDKLTKNTPLFEGDVWLGEKAQELGLVDGIGNYIDILRKDFKNKHPKFILIKQGNPFGNLPFAAAKAERPDLAAQVFEAIQQLSTPKIELR